MNLEYAAGDPRDEYHPPEKAEIVHQPDDLRLASRVLDVDIDPGIRATLLVPYRAQQLLEACQIGPLGPLAEVYERKIADAKQRSGARVHERIVNGKYLPVGGGPDIELDVFDATAQSAPHAGGRRFRARQSPSADAKEDDCSARAFPWVYWAYG